jgi:hypothetical protein
VRASWRRVDVYRPASAAVGGRIGFRFDDNCRVREFVSGQDGVSHAKRHLDRDVYFDCDTEPDGFAVAHADPYPDTEPHP